MFAVHSLHAPPIETDETGRRILHGNAVYALPDPLFTAETFAEAEEWRRKLLAMMHGAG